MVKWAGVENVQANSRGENVNAQHLAILEKYMGINFYSTYEAEQNNEHPENPNLQAVELLESAYNSFKSSIYSKLMSDNVGDLIEKIIPESYSDYVYDLSLVVEQLQDEIAANGFVWWRRRYRNELF